MSGDSHTNFDQAAFTVGALGGSAIIAGAMVSGFRNVATARRERSTAEAVTSRDVMIGSLQRRVDAQRSEISRRDATIRDQAMLISEMQVRLRMSQYLRQRGR